jgi:nucleotide-binding universal stress UspA family protein
METILVGYDGTTPAERALQRGAEFARTFHAGVVVVSVAPPPSAADARVPGAFGLFSYYPNAVEQFDETRRLDEELWRAHRARVEALFADAGVEVEFAGVAGEPVHELVEAADERHADLIVVGTREPGFLERLLGGSVSEGVARHARCDVLIVHPDDD